MSHASLPAELDQHGHPVSSDGVLTRQYLCLLVGQDTHVVSIEQVREILEVGRITPLPLTPPFVRGVMNLRGAVVPVIDLKARIGQEPAQIGRRSSVVIVTVGHGDSDGPLVVGLLVDGVSEVLEVTEDDIEPVPPLGTPMPREFLLGMAKAKGTILSVLDLERVLARETLTTLIAEYAHH
ncbi:chemotaxis protein CheW [Aquabacterium sp.]|uniref:chemotaxis protein CheW n=1 Tax=Aquabacterium sp. TaxID=1872578 RepID=UPI0035B30B23